MGFWTKKLLCVICLFLGATAYASDDVVTHDNSRISIFVQPAISFLSFEEREYFQNAVDTIYNEFRANALTEEETLSVAKQDFQKVNFCFPITGGLQFQVFDDQFISAGLGFIYDDESVVLTDRKNKTHNYSYTIQGIPLYLEYRLAIPLNLMTLSDGGLFSVALRWYWTLPGTEIYSTWGKIEAENSPLGAGFGFSVGYLIASWKRLNIFGDIGFSTIKVKSKKTFADLVPDGPEEKAKWDIGGLQLQIRVSFGLWNKPIPKDEDEDDDDGDNNESGKTQNAKEKPDSVNTKVLQKVKNDSTATDSATVDSAKADSATVVNTTTDSENVDSTAVKNSVADTAKVNAIATTKDSAATEKASANQNNATPKKVNIEDKDSAQKPAVPTAKEQ